MVLEMSGPDKHCLFVASSLEDREKAETEIASWAHTYGYQLPADRVFTLFSGQIQAREWLLVERADA